MARECQVRCRTEPGAVEGEMIVRLKVFGPDGESEACCFAYGDSVRKVDGTEVLCAHCLQENEEYAAVVLPQSTFANGPSVVVRKSELV